MNAQQRTLAQACLDATDADARTFPENVAALSEGGFESYLVDFRRSVVTFYLPDGDSLELPAHRAEADLAERLAPERLQAAIREAQTQAPGYTYRGFCQKAKAAGCAFYMVSFSGRRVVYFGRDGATHDEPFL